MSVRVRPARPEDAEAIRAVHRASILELGTETYDREQVEAWAAGVESADYSAIDDDDYYFVVAETDGTEGEDGVVAFGTLDCFEPGDYEADVDAEVTGVYVHPDAAREGVGTAVLRSLEERAQSEGFDRLGLTASANAVPFYDAHGYERVRAYDHEFSPHESTGVQGEVVEMYAEL